MSDVSVCGTYYLIVLCLATKNQLDIGEYFGFKSQASGLDVIVTFCWMDLIQGDGELLFTIHLCLRVDIILVQKLSFPVV